METEQTAEDVFHLLSDEIRVDILREVARARYDEIPIVTPGLSFSELYGRVDVDNTSKFSYHLGELTGTFLRKHEDRYRFTHAGEQMVRFILAENYLHPSDFQAIETDGSCLQCGTAALQAVPHDQYFMIQCTACESPAFTYKLTPAQVRGHTGTDLIDTVIWEQASDFLKMRQDVCPDCAGNMETEIRDLSGEPEAERLPTSLVTLSECQQCLRFMSVPITHAAAYHPESIVFHWKRGLDILATGVWEFHENLHTEQWTADHVDGPTGSYKVEFQHDSSSLRLYLDETAVVTKSERVRGKDHSASRS